MTHALNIIRRDAQDARTRIGIADLFIKADNPHLIDALADDWGFIRPDGKIQIASDIRVAERLAACVRQLDPREYRDTGLLYLRRHNAYVNTGLNNSLDREFGLGGTAIGFIGVSSNNTAVTAATVFLNGASGGAAANTIIKAISPAATRSSQTTTGGATFANADFTSGVFIWNKIGFLVTSTDAGTGLVDVIGGSGGSAPYNRTFTLDLVNAGTFSVVAQIAVTASAL